MDMKIIWLYRSLKAIDAQSRNRPLVVVVDATESPTLIARIFKPSTRTLYGPGSSVGIATDYGLDGPGIESRWGEIYRPSRPTMGPTQTSVQWVPCLSRG